MAVNINEFDIFAEATDPVLARYKKLYPDETVENYKSLTDFSKAFDEARLNMETLTLITTELAKITNQVKNLSVFKAGTVSMVSFLARFCPKAVENGQITDAFNKAVGKVTYKDIVKALKNDKIKIIKSTYLSKEKVDEMTDSQIESANEALKDFFTAVRVGRESKEFIIAYKQIASTSTPAKISSQMATVNAGRDSGNATKLDYYSSSKLDFFNARNKLIPLKVQQTDGSFVYNPVAIAAIATNTLQEFTSNEKKEKYGENISQFVSFIVDNRKTYSDDGKNILDAYVTQKEAEFKAAKTNTTDTFEDGDNAYAQFLAFKKDSYNLVNSEIEKVTKRFTITASESKPNAKIQDNRYICVYKGELCITNNVEPGDFGTSQVITASSLHEIDQVVSKTKLPALLSDFSTNLQYDPNYNPNATTAQSAVASAAQTNAGQSANTSTQTDAEQSAAAIGDNLVSEGATGEPEVDAANVLDGLTGAASQQNTRSADPANSADSANSGDPTRPVPKDTSVFALQANFNFNDFKNRFEVFNRVQISESSVDKISSTGRKRIFVDETLPPLDKAVQLIYQQAKLADNGDGKATAEINHIAALKATEMIIRVMPGFDPLQRAEISDNLNHQANEAISVLGTRDSVSTKTMDNITDMATNKLVNTLKQSYFDISALPQILGSNGFVVNAKGNPININQLFSSTITPILQIKNADETTLALQKELKEKGRINAETGKGLNNFKVDGTKYRVYTPFGSQKGYQEAYAKIAGVQPPDNPKKRQEYEKICRNALISLNKRVEPGPYSHKALAFVNWCVENGIYEANEKDLAKLNRLLGTDEQKLMPAVFSAGNLTGAPTAGNVGTGTNNPGTGNGVGGNGAGNNIGGNGSNNPSTEGDNIIYLGPNNGKAPLTLNPGLSDLAIKPMLLGDGKGVQFKDIKFDEDGNIVSLVRTKNNVEVDFDFTKNTAIWHYKKGDVIKMISRQMEEELSSLINGTFAKVIAAETAGETVGKTAGETAKDTIGESVGETAKDTANEISKEKANETVGGIKAGESKDDAKVENEQPKVDPKKQMIDSPSVSVRAINDILSQENIKEVILNEDLSVKIVKGETEDKNTTININENTATNHREGGKYKTRDLSENTQQKVLTTIDSAKKGLSIKKPETKPYKPAGKTVTAANGKTIRVIPKPNELKRDAARVANEIEAKERAEKHQQLMKENSKAAQTPSAEEMKKAAEEKRARKEAADEAKKLAEEAANAAEKPAAIGLDNETLGKVADVNKTPENKFTNSAIKNNDKPRNRPGTFGV